MSNAINIEFSTASRGEWIQQIVESREHIERGCTELHLLLKKDISLRNFEPMHFVTLSCLIDVAKVRGALVWLAIENEDLRAFVANDVRLSSYWREKQIPYFKEPEEKPFNLWRIKDTTYYNYTFALNKFFQNRYFKGKDLSGLNNCITELFQNVFDHAEADGTAFSFIEYKEEAAIINIAVCDFGRGIPETLKKQYPNESEALEKSLQHGITAGSQKHNKGYGMENILSTMTNEDNMRIISNHAMLYHHNTTSQLIDLNFNFKGTLLYMTIHIDSFPDEEIIDSFTF